MRVVSVVAVLMVGVVSTPALQGMHDPDDRVAPGGVTGNTGPASIQDAMAEDSPRAVRSVIAAEAGNEGQTQSPTREEVMAAYLINFVRNVEWPHEEQLDDFHITLVTGEARLGEALKRVAASKSIRKHAIRISTVLHFTTADGVQLVFVGRDKQESLVEVFDRIEGKNILLVSDRYIEKRVVMINFLETPDHTLRFEINKANILNQGLALMPDLVLLGGTEIDVAGLYRESQLSLRNLQKQVEVLRQREQELNRTISASAIEIARQEHAMSVQNAAIDSQRVRLGVQQSSLEQVLGDIVRKQDTLRLQSSVIAKRGEELRQQRAAIDQGDTVLTAQRETIEGQRLAIEHQMLALEEQGETISTQQKVLFLAIAGAVLGIGLSISVFRGYVSRKRINARLTREIDERKAIEVALGKSEDLYYRAPCGYHSLDQNGVFVQVNDTELEWLGYTREEVVGTLYFGDLLDGPARQEFEEQFPGFKARGVLRNQELELIRKDKTSLPVILSATVIRDGNGEFLMSRSTSVDITERKMAEMEIRRLNYALEQRVKERTRDLETANKELEAFAYSVSHDLRAPLRGIDGFSQLLLEQYEDHLDGKGKDYLRRVRAGAQRMGHLIDAMLDLSRVSRAGLSVRSLNMSHMARDIMRELSDASPQRLRTIIIADNLEARGDPRLLRVVLENLLGNAWKYTGKKEHTHIEFGRMETPDGPGFFIRDNGAGFDMQYVGKLFGAFQRLHTTAEFPGTGVGLATVQRIISKHGGSVWATGVPGSGATFSFTLP
jgi:PAS domain S-box-containing protein